MRGLTGKVIAVNILNNNGCFRADGESGRAWGEVFLTVDRWMGEIKNMSYQCSSDMMDYLSSMMALLMNLDSERKKFMIWSMILQCLLILMLSYVTLFLL